MAFKSNDTQQLPIEDAFLNLSPRVQRFVQKSWATGFSDIVFPAINETRFAVLYSDNPASRPNAPVNAVIGSLLLKEMFSMTDEELLESILCDVRFQVALRTTSFREQPFSDRTFSRFRERLDQHELETGEDLLKDEMEALAETFRKYLGMEPTLKRMDSLMVSSNSRKMSRLEILYTCVANLANTVHRTGETQRLKNMEHFLKEQDRNRFLYHRRNEDLDGRLQEITDKGASLLQTLPAHYREFEDFQLLERVMNEQTHTGQDGTTTPKAKKDISPQSLQNPSDPDATYRRKAGKDHKGYVANIVETTHEKGTLITAYEYQPNSHSDSRFCQKTLEQMGHQEHKTTLVADGAYASVANEAAAREKNIQLVTTALIGKPPEEVQADFVLDTVYKKMIQCPAGEKPYKTRFYEKTGTYRASFQKGTCEECPLRDKCGVAFQKKSAYVMVTEKTVARATYLKQMSSEEDQQFAKIRNGVEGIPSVLRRAYKVDHIPVRGSLRSKTWFGFKIGGINAKRVLKRALEAKKVVCVFGIVVALFRKPMRRVKFLPLAC